MRPTSPALLERIVERLRTGPSPRSSADLAREFLGVGILDEVQADRLLIPVLGAEPRLIHTDQGWKAVDQVFSGPKPEWFLGRPFLAVFAPVYPAAVVTKGPADAAYSVAPGGEAEIQRAEVRLDRSLPRPVISLGRVARRLRGYRGPTDPLRIAEGLRLPHLQIDEPEGMARLISDLWEHWREELKLEDILSEVDLERLLEERLEPADFSGKEFGPADLEGLPQGPGVYLFSRWDGRTLYVGQSFCLRARVASYFNGPPRDEKDRAIRTQASGLRFSSTGTAADALLVEARWIQRFRPLLNTRRTIPSAGEGEGILAVPGGQKGPPFVLFVIRQGCLLERLALHPGPQRARAAAGRAAAALFSIRKKGQLDREAGALLTTWRRLHPECPFITPEGIGNPRRAVDQLLALLG